MGTSIGVRTRFVRRVSLFAVMGTFLAAATVADEPDQNENAASLQRVREKAGQFIISRRGTRENRLRMAPTPLLRYSDPLNGYRDAAVWVWELDGVPVALAKVEDRDSQNMWQYCVASLASDEIVVSRPGQKTWQSKGPGITFQEISGTPADIETPFRRLQVMKSLARRFGGKFQMGSTGARDHLRAMPRPIHRFSSARMGVVDGSIFAFAVSGTNPTALVVIALRENSDDGKKRHWEYGVVGMTADAASIYLDDHVVWSKKADYTKRFYENWYFHQQVKLNAENAGTALRDSSTLQPTP